MLRAGVFSELDGDRGLMGVSACLGDDWAVAWEFAGWGKILGEIIIRGPDRR